MYTLLKRNKLYFIILVFIFFIIPSIFYSLIFFDNDFKKKPLVSFDSIDYEKNEYENFAKNIKQNGFLNNDLPLIAHAGGGYKDLTYTNSIDTLEFNKNNYELFELDFFLTNDGKLVCAHDWSENLKSFEKFEIYANKKKNFKPCTYKSLINWLTSNPKKRIVTDFKNDNLSGLKFIAKNFDNFKEVFIPQIYNPKEYKIVKDMGYKDIIWTLYRYNGSNKKIIRYAKKMKLFAITMPKDRAQSELPSDLKKENTRSYVHTINSMKEYFIYTNHFNIDQIYTDWIK